MSLEESQDRDDDEVNWSICVYSQQKVITTSGRSLRRTTLKRIRDQNWRRTILLLIPLLFFLSSLVPECQASVTCETNDECSSLLRPGSECINNECTNPFQQGCLKSYLGEEAYSALRTCNSEDTIHNTTASLCTPSPLDYSEIRILSQNWESAMFTAWILQIVLSEFVQVPATIESSGPGRQLNFYDPAMSFSYGAMGYDFDALKRANDRGGGSCPPTWRQSEDDYQSCAHVIPEVWSGHASTVAELTAQGTSEPPEGTGVVGKLGWFIPKYLAKRDPSLAHWLGLSGGDNRRKVAETFRVPTTYGMYCAEIVTDNCTEPTLHASRPPVDEAEAAKYFVPGGAFNGYFRFTDENDCDLNPDTCVGHITDVPCEWTTFVTPQAHHLDLPVKSRGPLAPNNAYSYGQLLDIWAAANATRSPILLYWWYPDPTYQFYLGSEAEMQAVQLPPPRQVCITNRVTPAQRCGEDEVARMGVEAGSCDSEPHALVKVVIANLFHYVQGRIPENLGQNESTAGETAAAIERQNPALRSPGYDALQAFSITELQLGEIADAWENRGLDKWNYDPREAVCEWVVNNLETLQTWIPRTYPRKVVQEPYNHGNEVLYGFAVGVGCVVSVIVIATSVLAFIWRSRPLLVFCQVNFLFLLLIGLLLVAMGSVLVALEPQDSTCVLQNWCILLGYTLELVPLIVKVGAIHRMMRAAKRMKRITLDQRQLYMTVLFFCVLVALVLSVWTAVDPSERNSEIKLHPNRQTDDGETIVTIQYFCAAENNNEVWRYVSLCWQVVLLLCATVLAFQTRNIRQDLNESHTLAVMIYSHFVFLIFRVITFVLSGEDESGDAMISPNTMEGIRSLLLSLDVLAATSIYFGPKMYGLFKYDDEYFKAVMAIQRRQSIHRSSAVNRSSLGSQFDYHGSGGSQPMQSSFSKRGSFSALELAVSSSDVHSGMDRNAGIDSSSEPRKRRSSNVSHSSAYDVVGDISLVAKSTISDTKNSLGGTSANAPNSGTDVDNKETLDEAQCVADSARLIASSASADRSEVSTENGIRSFESVTEKDHPEEHVTALESAPKVLPAFEDDDAELRNLQESEEKTMAHFKRLSNREEMTKDMFLDYIESFNDKNSRRNSWSRVEDQDNLEAAPRRTKWSSLSGSKSESQSEAVTETSADETNNNPGVALIEASTEKKDPEVAGIEARTEKQESPNRLNPIDELQRFEKLCGNDDKLGGEHYFF